MIILNVAVILILVTIGVFVYIKKPFKHNNKMSIREAVMLTGLPIITFTCQNKKLNFLLDTGSNNSHISTRVANKLNIQKEASICTTGFGNRTIKVYGGNVDLEYKDNIFNITLFISNNLDSGFDNIKQETGVTIHGVLGTDFLEKYKYIINFNTMDIYNKK